MYLGLIEERAKKTIDKYETMSLNAQDAGVFFNALAKSVRFNKKIEAAFQEHHERVISK